MESSTKNKSNNNNTYISEFAATAMTAPTTNSNEIVVGGDSPQLILPPLLPKLVVKKRKFAIHRSLSTGNQRPQQRVSNSASHQRQCQSSIPTFIPRRRHQQPTLSIPSTNNNNHHHGDVNSDDDVNNDNNNSEFDDDTIDHYIAHTVESLETYMAIQSLQQSVETCMIIPLSTTTLSYLRPIGARSASSTTFTTAAIDHMRGVLECQIMEYFFSASSNKNNSNNTTTTTTNSNSDHYNGNHSTRDNSTTRKCSVSKRKIQKQLQYLQQQNIITCIPIIQHETSHSLYLFTNEYTQYLWHQQHQEQQYPSDTIPTTNATNAAGAVLEWWIQQLSNKTMVGTKGSPYITVFDIEQAWDQQIEQRIHTKSVDASSSVAPSSLNGKKIVPYLQEAQLIMSASNDHSTYQLWLPNVWGTMVLPKLLQLCKDVVLYIKRSSYQERSITSIVERFPNPNATPQHVTFTKTRHMTTATHAYTTKNATNIHISIQHVIIPYLVSQRRVQRMERPSGMFLKLPE